ETSVVFPSTVPRSALVELDLNRHGYKPRSPMLHFGPTETRYASRRARKKRPPAALCWKSVLLGRPRRALRFAGSPSKCLHSPRLARARVLCIKAAGGSPIPRLTPLLGRSRSPPQRRAAAANHQELSRCRPRSTQVRRRNPYWSREPVPEVHHLVTEPRGSAD